MKKSIRFYRIFCFFVAGVISFSLALCQTQFWIADFESGTGNNAWTVGSTSANVPAGVCGYGGSNGGSSNIWERTCTENGNAAGTCGSGCGSNETMHVTDVTCGGCTGAVYDASWTTCKMVQSPDIDTNPAGSNTITLRFEYISYGEPGWDVIQLLYSTNSGTSWTFLENPIPVALCCGGVACDGQTQGLWTTRSYTLPASVNNITTFRIGFNWKNDDVAGSDPSFAANDVRLLYTSAAPVNLISFLGKSKQEGVQLEWKTANETNFEGFEIERSSDGIGFTKISYVDAKGMESGASYSYMDSDVYYDYEPVYYYRLREIDTDGSSNYSNVIEIKNTQLTKPFISELYPNPVEWQAKISIALPQEMKVKISVYNTLGDKVLDIANDSMKTGLKIFKIPTYNLTSGLYYVKVILPFESYTRKMVVVK